MRSSVPGPNKGLGTERKHISFKAIHKRDWLYEGPREVFLESSTSDLTAHQIDCQTYVGRRASQAV